MRTLKRGCAVSILTLALSLSAFAGEIETTVAPPQPIQQVTKQGEIETTRTGKIQNTITATTLEIALNLLQSVLSLI